MDGWLRFHTLPGSKRYADTPGEAAEVLRRVSAVGDAVLGREARCQLLLIEAYGEFHADAYRKVREAFGLIPAWSFDDPEDDELVWAVHKTQVGWSGAAFAPLLSMIADDEIANVLWFSESGSVFAPYDGGIDVFMRPAERAQSVRARFADWLSPRPDGL
ncbi:hypothetical protein [Phenylobacterium aquaticum]|uniref:DUF3885 domain-containing protein n=1 Tax=Phenylobacterium aquaticum TaxID=1763816 RepID=UPI0026EEE25A|nr:hypothetical protein [Phenylobacterium aquaticum]